MSRNLHSMIQVFIRMIFRSIGRQEKHFNFILAPILFSLQRDVTLSLMRCPYFAGAILPYTG